MKLRRHHNNKGYRQVKRGKTYLQLKRIARKLRLPFRMNDSEHAADERKESPNA